MAWRHYCPSGGGLAIQTTWRRIAHIHAALRAKDENVFCRAVQYLDPLSELLPSTEHGEEIFWKANWFSDETEIRFAVMRHLSGTHDQIRKAIAEKPFGERIACDLNHLVCAIVVNPFVSCEQRITLQQTLEKFQPALAHRVRDSVIGVGEG